MPLLELAKQLRVESRVIMPGFVSEKRKYQYLQAADVFVSTTSHEGFGLMYVEGMSCRLPIISYDHGGQTDFLEDGKTGFLIRLNDQEAFRQRLESLIEDSKLRETMGEYNLTVSKRFTVRQCALQYEQLFGDMISAKASSCAPAGRRSGAAITDPSAAQKIEAEFGWRNRQRIQQLKKLR